MNEMREVDCRGMACPQPVLTTKDVLKDTAEPFRVIVDNEGARENVRRFAVSQGAEVSVEEREGGYYLTVRPSRHAPASQEPVIVCDTTSPRNLVVYVASDVMGRGDDELGGILMAAFLDTLSHFKGILSHAIFANGGARLAVEGSPMLAQLKQLEELGVEVLVCGTCLNHFGLTDRLAVGSISNIYAIIEVLSKAGRIIQP